MLIACTIHIFISTIAEDSSNLVMIRFLSGSI